MNPMAYDPSDLPPTHATPKMNGMEATLPAKESVDLDTTSVMFFDGVCNLCNRIGRLPYPQRQKRACCASPLQGLAARADARSRDVRGTPQRRLPRSERHLPTLDGRAQGRGQTRRSSGPPSKWSPYNPPPDSGRGLQLDPQIDTSGSANETPAASQPRRSGPRS